MPIVDVEIVVAEADVLPANMAQQLADAIGSVFTAPPGRTWLRLRALRRDRYAEHGGATDDIQPVFVSVLKAQRPTDVALRDEIAQLTTEVARLVRRAPENVHVLYLPDARGRIAFGGELVE
jgi:phenylpyruvate tautomerase PptA (4-oxalocrotonate tautomerase family)